MTNISELETTKTINGEDFPSSDFLVVEEGDKPSTWRLQVKRHGTPDHHLMGAAKAALTSSGGHRGNRYTGPHKEEAIRKLKALYAAEKMAWDEVTEQQVGGFLFADLSKTDLTDGKAFDGVAAGTFIDMWGRKITLDGKDFANMVANTQEMIAASATEGGEVVGLPIDANNHDKGDAAGWIVGAELVGGVIRLIPRWTEVGLRLIGKGIRRMFSATINPKGNVILGGTLTNWPATRDDRGKMLLRPIELSECLFEFEDSLDQQAGHVRRAFNKAFNVRNELRGYLWAREVYANYLIVDENDGEKIWKVFYSEKDGGYTFAEREKWKSVRQEYVEQAQAPDTTVEAGAEERPDETNLEGDKEMADVTISEEKLATLVSEQVKATMEANTRQEKPTNKPEDLIAMFDLQGASEEVQAAVRGALIEQYDLIQQKAKHEAAEMIARVKRESNIAEFAQKMTGGDKDTPFGLPVKTDELEEWLWGLNPDQEKFARKLLEATAKGGMIDYRELGHGGEAPGGSKQLPEEYAKKLDSGTLKIADLADPLLALGNVSDYDLSKWQGK